MRGGYAGEMTGLAPDLDRDPRASGPAARRPRRGGDPDRLEGIPSRAAILGHPIHPILIPYPVAYLSTVAMTDLAYWRTRDPFWAEASRWLLRAGLVAGGVAGAAGAVDYATIGRVRRHPVGPLHAVGNVAALALTAWNLALRRNDPEENVVPRGLAVSASVAALLGLTAWAGSELVYRHMVAVVGHNDQHGDEREE
ncbi:MAG TPA: DUF2231 domain-containing protein [Azospirillaceae bacterium]|nr:DUF2231 domain-containing protein [Azospirillaceae bacterium]